MKHRLPDWLIFAACGAAMGLAYPPFSLAPLALAALAVAIYAVPKDAGARALFLQGWWLGAGHFAVALHWIVEPFLVDAARHGWMAPFGLFFLAGGLALFWGGAFVAAMRGKAALALALPLAEFARAHIFTGFPWAIPAHGWVGTYVYWGTEWIGPHGLMLALTLAAVLMARNRTLLGAGSVLAVALWLVPVPGPEPLSTDRPTVRLVQANAAQDQKWDPQMMPVFYNRYLSGTATGAPAALTLWPETAVPFILERGDAYFEEIAAAARGGQVGLGLLSYDGVLRYNAAALIGQSGQVAATYNKDLLVPFGEYIPFGNVLGRFGIRGLAQDEGAGYARGGAQPLWDIPGVGTARVLICYESIFPEEILGADRPDLLIVLTNDAWFGSFAGPFQHLALAQARAIELGLPVLRSANTGVSAIIDARGRILDQINLNVAGTLDGVIPTARDATLYARFGDWIFSGIWLVLFATTLARRRFVH